MRATLHHRAYIRFGRAVGRQTLIKQIIIQHKQTGGKKQTATTQRCDGKISNVRTFDNIFAEKSSVFSSSPIHFFAFVPKCVCGVCVYEFVALLPPDENQRNEM